MPGFTIRPLAPADVPAAQAVMMRSVVEDFGAEHDAVIHADIDDLLGTYDRADGPFMLVVVDEVTDQIVATGGMRDGRLRPGVTPEDLVERYDDGSTGQVVRVYTLREHRRRGIAKALVRNVLDKAARDGHYERIAFHTLLSSPGAVAFWTAMGAELVHDDTYGPSEAMYYEFPALARIP
ncbi:GNAT family N-acetyltransferase [Ruania alba]|uniref:Ribosomal protein S18 acetylase RimI n=1 Tax=Ruania alba TaxID=648782 RepID=A0A1H5HQY9_9MICO|nr:GNAT family N-acetyltransferase [Ruania alba]SEE29728.1 Ribosomal protein S18 acetylase RimI [Ruania alba]